MEIVAIGQEVDAGRFWALDKDGNPKALEVFTYRVEGLDRELSIGQLVMTICLQRATELEDRVVEKMAGMADVTIRLECLTGMQEALVKLDPDKLGDFSYDNSAWPDAGKYNTTLNKDLLLAFMKDPKDKGGLGLTLVTDPKPEDLVTSLSTAMDDYNSVNQKEMIELQSLTNKRDQSYDLITNALKSFHTVMLGAANNL